jgi:hydroxymethylpyrimidine/phosphomethylpyrimidine kinase
MPVALTIAGSDSSGGAGIQADLKVFNLLDVFGASVLTCVTAQNTTGVAAALALPLELIVQQIDTTVADIRPDAFKTGMLFSAAIIEQVAEAIRRHRLTNYVCDPVMIAKSQSSLIQEDAVQTLKRRLLPLASLVTPNRFEAARLAGMPLEAMASVEAAVEAGRRIMALGAAAVVVKGIPIDAQRVDVLCQGGQVHRFVSPGVENAATHGSGCAYSAAITAGLARGLGLFESIERARSLVHRAISSIPGIGRGAQPVNLLTGVHLGASAK